jgi:hypothetical protein
MIEQRIERLEIRVDRPDEQQRSCPEELRRRQAMQQSQQ